VDPRTDAAARRRRRRRKTQTRCVTPRKRRTRKKKHARSALVESPYPQRRPRAGSAGGRPEVESAAKRRRRHVRACVKKKKKKPKRRPPLQPVPQPPAPPAPPVQLTSPVAIYAGAFGVRQAERLLWRAGFGPSPGHAEFLAAMGLHAAVAALTRPSGGPTLTGAAPADEDGNALAPADLYGHDHLWWLDRMVRTNQPLVERMTLVWHDWFSTSNDGVGQQQLMLDQNELFRRNAFGSFEQLAHDVTQDPAMIVWLNLDQNRRQSINENYARELMELFTLGADRGAYTEQDVRQLARALTGFDFDWSDELGMHNFRYVPSRHDTGNKTIFGQTGAFTWEQGVGLCVRHAMHPSFFVQKLWSYFIPTPPSAGDRQALEALYVSSGYEVRPVLEAILLHPDLHAGPRMVKPPIVLLAGVLRALQRSVDGEYWIWYSENAGQRLFYPPDVSGWDDSRWLDTSTTHGRFELVSRALSGRVLDDDAVDAYGATETPEQAVAAARAWAHDPSLSSETVALLTSFATDALAGAAGWQQTTYRGLRQNALRQLVLTSPDYQTS
jgi:uncharacterized protein (DUF1800 family)